MTSSAKSKSQLWGERFQQFDQSSLTVAQYCQSVGCSVQTFYQWRRKLRHQPGSASVRSTPESAFLQVRTDASLSISIELRSGVVILLPIEAIDALPSILERVA